MRTWRYWAEEKQLAMAFAKAVDGVIFDNPYGGYDIYATPENACKADLIHWFDMGIYE